MKLAYESETKGIDTPKFPSLTMLWTLDDSFEAFDLIGKPACSNQWCYDKKCLGRIYITYQMGLRTTFEHDIKPTLEGFDQVKGEGAKGLETFSRLLESRHLIELLPGVAPGFALRNRRWGESTQTLLEPRRTQTFLELCGEMH